MLRAEQERKSITQQGYIAKERIEIYGAMAVGAEILNTLDIEQDFDSCDSVQFILFPK